MSLTLPTQYDFLGRFYRLAIINVSWLLSLLGFSSISAVLDGYFAGLAEREALRNSSLIGAMFGFAPFAGYSREDESVS